jgi:cytochrome c oxidase subunit III
MLSATTSMPEQTKIATPKIVLWTSMVSMIMLFAGLTSGYILRQSEGNWLVFELPSAFFVSSVIIIASSLTMYGAQRAVKKNNISDVKTWIIITSGLGLAFVFSQFIGYNQLMKQGLHLTGKGTNISASWLYIISGLHVVHVAGGILSLLYTSGKALQEKYNSTNSLGIEVCATYWHFMGFLWLYLFVFLAAIR